MEPRVSLVTLGVNGLERSVAFYSDGLGWPKPACSGCPPCCLYSPNLVSDRSHCAFKAIITTFQVARIIRVGN